MEANLLKYHHLTILSTYNRTSSKGHRIHKYAVCLCDCGNTKEILLENVVSGHTKSCSCFRTKLHTTHGLSTHKIAKVRHAMISRCHNSKSKSYPNYGGRGISVCNEWRHNPQSFFDWMFSMGWKEGLTLDRIDVDGNYCPENCRLITNLAQQNNRRDTRLFTVDGVTKSISDWARFYNIPYTKLNWPTIRKTKRKPFAYALYNPNMRD